MQAPTRLRLQAQMAAHGHDCPDDEIDRLIPVLAGALPLIAALQALPLDEIEPAVGFAVDKR